MLSYYEATYECPKLEETRRYSLSIASTTRREGPHTDSGFEWVTGLSVRPVDGSHRRRHQPCNARRAQHSYGHGHMYTSSFPSSHQSSSSSLPLHATLPSLLRKVGSNRGTEDSPSVEPMKFLPLYDMWHLSRTALLSEFQISSHLTCNCNHQRWCKQGMHFSLLSVVTRENARRR
jgi:hypothetical protein